MILGLIAVGISLGAFYATLALGLWVIFAVTRTFHIAHAGVMLASSYALYAGVVLWGWPLGLGLLASLVVAVTLGAAIELWIYRRVRERGASGLSLFVVSFALVTLISSLVGVLFGEESHGIVKTDLPVVLVVAQTQVTIFDLANVIVAVAAGIGVYLFTKHHPVGRALRAVQNNEALAAYFGIDVNRIFVASFVLGSALLTPAVASLALANGVNLDLAFYPVLVAFTAVIAGGVESQAGSMAAGFAIGLLQSAALLWVSASWQPLITFGLLSVVLILRPRGLRAAVQTSMQRPQRH